MDGSPAVTVLSGGAVLTMDPARPRATCVVVEDRRIRAVGGPELAAAHPDATSVDLAGRTLLPGFIDAHNHLCLAALQPRWRDVGGAGDVEELLAGVIAQAAAEPEADWVRVSGWNGAPHGVTVTRDDLDRLGLDRPVLVAHYSLHLGVVDSRGLDLLGIGPTTADPAGGEIGRGPDGRPDGMLVERAWSEAHRRSLDSFTEPDRWADHIAAHARRLLAEGVTAVHDAACPPAAEAVYRSMAATGSLPLSVLVMPHPAALLTHEFGSRLDGAPTGEGDETLRIGPAKLFADGGVAIALDVTVGGHPVRLGLTMDDLVDHAKGAADRGWRLAVHAIGNVGVTRAIDAFAAVARASPAEDHRFRVEHALVTGPSQWRDLAALGAIGVVQPGFVEHVGSQAGGARFDEHHWLAFAGLAEAGVTLAASSDDPCAPFPPLWCAHKGQTRRTDDGTALEPEQTVPVEAWLRAYTDGAARAGGQEAERGSITPGKRADFVVLDGPLSDDGLPAVAETWVGGTVAHRTDPPPDHRPELR